FACFLQKTVRPDKRFSTPDQALEENISHETVTSPQNVGGSFCSTVAGSGPRPSSIRRQQAFGPVPGTEHGAAADNRRPHSGGVSTAGPVATGTRQAEGLA